MKIKSALMTQASGSLAGMTASHNRGGLYLRARATPVNPNTPQQQVVRGLVSELSGLWLNALSVLQRGSWDTYALQVPLPDRLGEPRNVGGLAMYIRSNVPRLQVGLPRVDDGPTIFNLGNYGDPVLSVLTEALQQVTAEFAIAEAWPGEDDAAMLFFASRPQNPSVNYFKGPYRRVSTLLGNTAIPLASPQQVAAAFPFVLGQKVFFRYNVTRADGRLGSQGFTVQTAVA